jgi:hypothetical protein
MQNENIPLLESYVKIIVAELDWDSIKWGISSIDFGSVTIENFINYKFYDKKIITNPDVISLDD